MNLPSNKSDLENALSAIFSVSQKMLMLAREGEWSQVIELELKRKESLNSFFAVFHGVEIERDIVKATLEQVQESDRQLLALAKNAQQDIATALSMLGRSRQCIEQYHQNQDLP